MQADITYLLLQATSGDLEAFDELVRQTQHDVQRFITSLIGPTGLGGSVGTEATDLTQESFIRAWRSAQTFTGAASGRTWLFGVARNVVADHARRQARRGRIRRFVSLSANKAHNSTDYSERAGVPNPDPADSNRFDENHALNQLVDQLEPERKEAFVLTQMVGLSYAEVAEICGVPLGTVRSRVARARESLADAYRNAENDRQAM